MRTSLRRLLPLPPVPPRETWTRKFPSSNFNVVNRLTADGGGRAVSKGGKRTQVADTALANSIARKLDIQNDQVVLEAYPGMGFLTRAILALPPDVRPRKVLSIEPSVDFNVHGLNLTPEQALSGWSPLNGTGGGGGGDDGDDGDDGNSKAKQTLLAKRRDAVREILAGLAKKGQSTPDLDAVTRDDAAAAINESMGTPVFRAFPSEDDSALTIIDGTMFDWKTVPALEEQGLLDDVQRREWQDEPPNLHYIATIPDSDMGEQLVNQWVSCVAGPSWLFRFGRVKMSFLVKPTLYDRLTAVPGTRAYCKLSVITSALCEVHPATPLYPPGPDAAVPVSLRLKREKEALEKQGAKSGMSVLAPRKPKKTKKAMTEPEPEIASIASSPSFSDPILSADPDLWYPKFRRTLTEQKQPPRPGMMALTLVPRKEPQILPDDKDVWDYILRRMFVNPGSPLEVAINNLGMGATNLVPKLTDPSLPADKRIEPTKWIREYTVQDWSLIVEAFKKWPFAPDVLVLGTLLEEDNDTRQVGSGM
ncbi:hypothetical protein NliqN6_5340 [Naganishia liquefaciens]|uniref:rRNA adenine N(6)-methyltransferase n=1 Tax=Naganishia liquefaciens TaxID=104408 RepID=A0A8H3TY22_9TREE|nr:hypothetical protein NliqN6_5340 [Naganishia liquefaciens]